MEYGRRAFLKGVAGAGALAACMKSGRSAEVPKARVPSFAIGAEELPPILGHGTIRTAPHTGKGVSFFIDDAIWFLRDLTRKRPASLFDNPFLKMLKESHAAYGLKLQINLFYRTDFFYGMDEFTLANVTDAYKAEWQANKDWLKLGFHSLQEFPDYPWINADYADVKKMHGMVSGEVRRFAGEGVFTTALVPHWCPMSKEGCRALKDCGIRIINCTDGPRYRYDGKRDRLPYGHGFKLEQNRKPETAFFWRDSRNADILASVCSYNHISSKQAAATLRSYNYVWDEETGLAFKVMFGDAPCLNLCTPEQLVGDITPLLDREYLIFSDHEQYFFSDYLAYQPDYAEKIRIMCRMVTEKGFKFQFIEELV